MTRGPRRMAAVLRRRLGHRLRVGAADGGAAGRHAPGPGPVLMAGAEMIKLLKNDRFTIASGIIQYIPKSPQP